MEKYKKLKLEDMEKINTLEFFKLPKKVYKEINPYEIITYTFLLNRWLLSCFKNWEDENKNIYLVGEIKDLSKEMGIARSTLIKTIQSLENKQYIEVKRKRNRGNIYYLTNKILELKDALND